MKIVPELFFPIAIIIILVVVLTIDIIIVFNVEAWKKFENNLKEKNSKMLLWPVVVFRWIALICCPIPALAIWMKAREEKNNSKC